MIKKRIFSLILCIVMITLYACSNAGAYDEDEGGSVAELFPDYEYNEIAVQYCAGPLASISESGYYYKFNSTLYYYDVDKDINMPLCSRTDCSHKTAQCDAYVTEGDSSDALTTGNCIDAVIFYYNDHIYMIERDEEDIEYLVQYDKNFNNKEVLSELSSGPSDRFGTYGENTHQCVILNGYMYHFNCDCRQIIADEGYYGKIFCSRVKLEKGAKPERLGEFELGGDYGSLGDPTAVICVSGDTVYYIAGGTYRWFVKEDTVQYRVASYNTKTNEFKMVMSYTSDSGVDAWGEGTGVVQTISGNAICMDSKDNVYMVSKLDGSEGIVKYNMSTKEAKVIYKSTYDEIHEIMCDGQNIFISEKNKREYTGEPLERIMALDDSGKILAVKDLEYAEEFIEHVKELAQKRGEDEDKALQHRAGPEVDIYIVDDRYIMLTSYSDGAAGLISGDFSKDVPNGANGVGLINKADFLSGQDCDIKQIHQYWEN